MRTLIVGTGAVGGFYGAKLARAGHEVVFTARGRNLEEIRARGLRLESFQGDIVVSPARAVETPEGLAAFELVLVCVKVQDTEAALEGLSGAIGAGTVVVSLQNGVESEELIERRLGLEPMIRGLAYVGVELVAPGVVRHASGGTILIGERDDHPSPRLERLERMLREAEIEVVVPQSIARAKWQKLAWNASFNVICALTCATIGGALASLEGRSLVQAAMGEVEAVARAQGIEFEPGHIPSMLRYAERIPFVRPSTLQDREKGKPLEHDTLTGAVVRFGARVGVPTPVNQTLDALARLVSSARAERS
jgi:2-dehydropantoate 2-reductase